MGKKIVRLSNALAGILNARGLQRSLIEGRIRAQWEKSVGEVVARHAVLHTVRGAKLFLTVDSPAWMQQLSLLKPEIIENVNRGPGQGAIREIVLNLGVVPPAAAHRPEPMKRRELTNEERSRIEEAVASVRDPDVRQSLRRLMEKDFLSKALSGK